MKDKLRFKIKRNGEFMVEELDSIRDNDTFLCFVNDCKQEVKVTGEATIITDDKQELLMRPIFLCEEHHKKMSKDLHDTRKVIPS